MTVGDRIKQRRLELGLSQEEVALKAGYKSRSSVNKLEGSRNLPLSKVEKMAIALECSPSYLMGWEDAFELKPMMKFSDVLNESKASGKTLYEITGLEIDPCDYENIKNARFHEVQKNYYDRIANAGVNENKENMKKYYLRKDAEEAAQFLFENPEYKVLFDATRKVKKDDIDFIAEMIKRASGIPDDSNC